MIDGDRVHVAGPTGFDDTAMTISDEVVEQTEQRMRNIGGVLAEAGCTFNDGSAFRHFLPNRDDVPPCWPVLRRYFGETRPAGTILICDLVDPRMKIEIEVETRRTTG